MKSTASPRAPIRPYTPPGSPRTPGAPAGPGPTLGEHTSEVLEALGYDEAQVAALKEAGAVAGPAGEGARGSFLG